MKSFRFESSRAGNIASMVAAIGLGCAPPLRWVLADGPLRFAAAACAKVGDATVVLATVILGASLQPTLARALSRLAPPPKAELPAGKEDDPATEVAPVLFRRFPGFTIKSTLQQRWNR